MLQVETTVNAVYIDIVITMICLVIKLACFQLMIMLLLGVSGSPEGCQRTIPRCSNNEIANKVSTDLLASAVQQCFNNFHNCENTGITIPFKPGDMFYPLR